MTLCSGFAKLIYLTTFIFFPTTPVPDTNYKCHFLAVKQINPLEFFNNTLILLGVLFVGLFKQIFYDNFLIKLIVIVLVNFDSYVQLWMSLME
jgi:hypothetical protein